MKRSRCFGRFLGESRLDLTIISSQMHEEFISEWKDLLTSVARVFSFSADEINILNILIVSWFVILSAFLKEFLWLIFESIILKRLFVVGFIFLGEILRRGSLIGLLLLRLKAFLIAWKRTLWILRSICIIEYRSKRLTVLLLEIWSVCRSGDNLKSLRRFHAFVW